MKARAAGFVGDALAKRLPAGVRVDVHQSRHHESFASVDLYVHVAAVVRSHVHDGVA
jgi:hypothetical protein